MKDDEPVVMEDGTTYHVLLRTTAVSIRYKGCTAVDDEWVDDLMDGRGTE